MFVIGLAGGKDIYRDFLPITPTNAKTTEHDTQHKNTGTMDTTLGPYRFNYPGDGLAIYKLGDLVEQYFLCNEHFWFQVLRVGGKMFKFRVSTHTEGEQRVKIWKTFRGVPREKSMYYDYCF